MIQNIHIYTFFISYLRELFKTSFNILQGWEDVIEACLNHLLRTILAKSDKDKLKGGPSTLDNITDLSRFKKHVSQVFDRLSKDSALLESQNSEEQGKYSVIINVLYKPV